MSSLVLQASHVLAMPSMAILGEYSTSGVLKSKIWESMGTSHVAGTSLGISQEHCQEITLSVLVIGTDVAPRDMNDEY